MWEPVYSKTKRNRITSALACVAAGHALVLTINIVYTEDLRRNPPGH